ncbi:MAG: hypothetical protein JW716_02420 [Candidatus Aenigmarchaeota archaeon]|nr:hypothetical protein [Candidatus Aenigmarchaeota archaeon]
MGRRGRPSEYGTYVNFKYLLPISPSETYSFLRGTKLYLHNSSNGAVSFFKGKSYLRVRDGSDFNDGGLISAALVKHEPVSVRYRKTLLDCWSFSTKEAEFARELLNRLKLYTDFAGFVFSQTNGFPELFCINDRNGAGFTPYMHAVPLIGSLRTEKEKVIRLEPEATLSLVVS